MVPAHLPRGDEHKGQEQEQDDKSKSKSKSARIYACKYAGGTVTLTAFMLYPSAPA